jgi:hypothetical protein
MYNTTGSLVRFENKIVYCVVKVYYKGTHNLMSDIYKHKQRRTNIGQVDSANHCTILRRYAALGVSPNLPAHLVT